MIDKTTEERDLDLAEQIAEHCMSGDLEIDHRDADDIIVSLIRRLGYTKTADAWDAVGKWYA